VYGREKAVNESAKRQVSNESASAAFGAYMLETGKIMAMMFGAIGAESSPSEKADMHAALDRDKAKVDAMKASVDAKEYRIEMLEAAGSPELSAKDAVLAEIRQKRPPTE
jgi:hypothetical protein